MKKIYIVKNMQLNDCFLVYKAFKTIKEIDDKFILVLDSWFDIFYLFGDLLDNIALSSDKNISKKTLSNDLLILDFEHYEFFKTRYTKQAWLEQNLGIKILDYRITAERDYEQDTLSACLMCLDYNPPSFLHANKSFTELKNNIVNYLKDYVAVNTLSNDPNSLVAFEEVLSHDLIICNDDFIGICARELDKPAIINIINDNSNLSESQQQKYFDPFRHDRRRSIPSYFGRDSKVIDLQNKEAFKYTASHLNIFLKLLLKVIDESGIPVKLSLPKPIIKIIN